MKNFMEIFDSLHMYVNLIFRTVFSCMCYVMKCTKFSVQKTDGKN
jgi:hypothetical protein